MHLTFDDGAPTAVAEAARRLAPFPDAEARTATLPGDLPAGPFELVVASEILYYLGDADFHTTLDWLADTALIPGGRLVAVHWLGSAPDLCRSAADVGAALARTPGLRELDRGAPTEGFRLDVLERRA